MLPVLGKKAVLEWCMKEAHLYHEMWPRYPSGYSNGSWLVWHDYTRAFGDGTRNVAAVAEWYRYRTVACFVTGSSPVPLKTRRVGQRCTLNLSRAETSSRWCGVVVRRGGASSGVVHVT
ncbi:uncharacterized protein TNCV_553901 [Trichonephila clavipes]|nr:uncharacterized protein TNCV_553901 [Trichonephila clavipes]